MGGADGNSSRGAGLPEDVGSLGAVGQDDSRAEVDQQGGAGLEDPGGRRVTLGIEEQLS